ncbi:MAG: CbiX/SirB N-terminal domain-containing protein [Pseudomonadota bacterium]
MKALLILAHGSRRKASNDEVAQLVDKVRRLADAEYKEITHAFLELSEPDIQTAIASLAEKGTNDISVLPYFLNSGNHVTQDIPELIEQAKSNFPDCNFHIASPIGLHQEMPALILQCAKQPNL